MGKIINGSGLSLLYKDRIKDEISILGDEISLAVILVGNDPASEIYVNNKQRAALYVGIKSIVIRLDANISQEVLNNKIIELNNDNSINGILLQLPLPEHLSEYESINIIDPNKDVDGLTSINVGHLNSNHPNIIPCTPKGIIALLDNINFEYSSKVAVIIGRSNLVGKPIARLLEQKNMTIIHCHSKTNNIKELVKLADLLVVAIGKANFIDDTYIKDGCTIIDVGINRLDNKLIGDVNLNSCINKVSYITPVPKGVGPMTICMLLENTYLCYMKQKGLTNA